MPVHKYRLKFTAPLHISARGVQFEQVSQIIHSDTLFGALVNAWGLLYPKEVDDFFTDAGPPFLLSSAFPYFGNWEFFPRPLALRLPESLAPEKQIGLNKKFKRVQFVESRAFNAILAGQTPPFDPAGTLSDGKFWLAAPPTDEHFILRQEEMPRVVIDRYTSSANNYFVSELYFEDDGGLFFLVRFEEDSLRSKFEAVLRLLGDEGLGLDRSSGKGMFEVECTSLFNLPEPANATRFVTLSLFHPTEKEIVSCLLTNASYELVHRSGWITTPGRATPFRRQTLTMFAEGSVFTALPVQSYGDMPAVLKEEFIKKNLDHGVFRYGYAFPVGMAGGIDL